MIVSVGRIGITILLCLIFSVLPIGCGFQEESGTVSSETSASIECNSGLCLKWIPPTSFSDGSELFPSQDLEEYVIYLNTTGIFVDEDEVAVLSAVNSGGVPATSFDLMNIFEKLDQGVTYYISMQSVTTSGTRSDLSPAMSFSLQ